MNHPAYKSECILFFTHQMAGSGEDWKRGHEEWKRDGDKSDAAQQWGIFYSNWSTKVTIFQWCPRERLGNIDLGVTDNKINVELQ